MALSALERARASGRDIGDGERRRPGGWLERRGPPSGRLGSLRMNLRFYQRASQLRSRFLAAQAIVAMLALSGCAGGGPATAPLGVTSTTGTSQALSAMEAPQSDALLAHAARIRAEGATSADNTHEVEAWTPFAEAAGSDAQAAKTLATEPQSAGEDTEAPPIPREVPLTSGGIATSFGSTRTDHYPLDVRNVRPERPEQPEIIACAANDAACLMDNWLLLFDYGSHLEVYEEELAEYEAGHNLIVVEAESAIASRGEVLALLQENIYTPVIDEADPRGNYSITDDGVISPIESHLVLHMSPPKVRFLSESIEGRIETIRAIDNINAWLPWDKHITIGEDIAPELIEDLQEAGEAYSRFVQVHCDPFCFDSEELSELYEALKNASDAVRGNNTIIANLEAEIEHASGYATPFDITIDKNSNMDIATIQHELLHALGMSGGKSCYEEFGASCDWNSGNVPMFYYSHVPVKKFPDSSMAYASLYDDKNGLSQIDGETIQSMYTRLVGIAEPIEWEPGLASIDRLDMESLGPWDADVVRYQGTFDEGFFPDSFDVVPAFGVDWRNGIARPWANGDTTQGDFSSSGLFGTATWRGDIVGFTPDREAVHGSSALQVDVDALTGNAAFTNLEHWDTGEAPGDRGTGRQWNDGDLHYLFEIHNREADDGPWIHWENYFRSTGGDAGYISGRFVGSEHLGVVGILERPDLTGAFGGTRREDSE